MTSRPLSDELLLGSGGLVWITFDNASGHRAISGLELVLESEVHSRAMLGQAIVDLRATITVNQTRTGWLRLGTAVARSAVHFPHGPENRQRRAELSLMVDQVTLAGLEAARDGDDLRLHVELAATAMTNDGLPLAGQQQVQWTIPTIRSRSLTISVAGVARHTLAPASIASSRTSTIRRSRAPSVTTSSSPGTPWAGRWRTNGGGPPARSHRIAARTCTVELEVMGPRAVDCGVGGASEGRRG